jgi:uncharacterized membrane protein YoaK (UPF0700 family)
VRIVGALLFALGVAATGYCLREIDRRRRPADVAFALAAPLAALIALLGLVLLFVPGFF